MLQLCFASPPVKGCHWFISLYKWQVVQVHPQGAIILRYGVDQGSIRYILYWSEAGHLCQFVPKKRYAAYRAVFALPAPYSTVSYCILIDSTSIVRCRCGVATSSRWLLLLYQHAVDTVKSSCICAVPALKLKIRGMCIVLPTRYRYVPLSRLPCGSCSIL